MWKFVFLIALLVAPLARASLESEVRCGRGFCLSFTKHDKAAFRDIYTYERASGLQHMVARFTDGSILEVLVTRSKTNSCKESFVRTLPANGRTVDGAGCLITKNGSSAVTLSIRLSGKTDDPEQFFIRTDPAIWLTAGDSGSAPVPPSSEVVPLYGSGFAQVP